MKRFIVRSLIVAGIVIAIAVLYVGINTLSHVGDAYAQWGAANMVIGYLRDHDGQWPRDWDALEPYFAKNNGRMGGAYAEFQSQISIDFSADPIQLQQLAANSTDVPFDVIHATSFWASQMDGGPNEMLYHYFRRKAGIIETPAPSGGWRSDDQKVLADQWFRRGFRVQFDERERLVAAWTALNGPARIGDRDLAELKVHRHLKELNLVGSDVTDDGLAVIRELPELEVLDLGADRITDEGIAHLMGHPRLESLDIFGTRITDAGLKRLLELPRLTSIRFDEERISAEAIRELKEALPNLEVRSQGELRARSP